MLGRLPIYIFNCLARIIFPHPPLLFTFDIDTSDISRKISASYDIKNIKKIKNVVRVVRPICLVWSLALQALQAAQWFVRMG
jgi:hypothetical protein